MLTVSVRLSSDTSCISRISCIRRISYRCTIYRQNTNNVSCWTYYTTIQILITTLKLLNFYGGTYTVNATSRSGPIAPLIQDGGRRPSWISWNANLSATDRCLHQIRWEDVSRPGEDDHVTKSRNRKLIRVTSSNTCREQKGVDWYRAQAPHYEYHELCRIHLTWNSKMAATAILNFRKNVNNSRFDKNICIKFYGRCTTAMWRWPRRKVETES